MHAHRLLAPRDSLAWYPRDKCPTFAGYDGNGSFVVYDDERPITLF